MIINEHNIVYMQPVPASSRYALRILGPEDVAQLTYAMVLDSIEFTCDPLPDDEYEITVKPDQLEHLNRLIKEITPGAFDA